MAAVNSLEKEGIVKGVHIVGDVMYDALLHNIALARKQSNILSQLNLKPGTYALATVHRAANTDDTAKMRSIMTAFGQLSTHIIFPLHPRTRKLLAQFDVSTPSNISLIDPVGYLDMLVLEENANCILTDSGGMQKEAYLLGVRCLTLRDETEWVETVEAGWNQLVGARSEAIQLGYKTWFPQGDRTAFYGDGQAAQKICDVLKNLE
jgi:UDP-N-acetylglucosamine 2-epimerase